MRSISSRRGAGFILVSALIVSKSFCQVVAGGSSHSLFLCNNGIPMASGDNGVYQLGDSTFTPPSKPTPVQVKGLTGIVAVGAGIAHSLFVKNDGTVWACGLNDHGQLGDGTTTNRIAPVQVSGLTGIVAATGGFGHSLFVKNDGSVWGCGNSVGQLGLGITSDKLIPVQIPGLSGIIAVAACSFRSMFLKNDGTVWGTGANNAGQLGIGNNNPQTSPVMATGLTNVIAIGAGELHSLFVKSDGTAWAVGKNIDGQLGDGTNADKNTAIQVSVLTGIVSTVGSEQGSSSYFLKNDGTVWVCGANDAGQLGIGSTLDQFTPVKINSLSGITSIGAGGSHALFVKNDGTVWTCGYNYSGQLGTGNTATQGVPVKTNGLCQALATQLETQQIQSEFRLFPNPMAESAVIEGDESIIGADLIICNSLGQQILMTKNNTQQTIKFDRGNLSTGVYFLTVTKEKKLLWTKKLVVVGN